MKKHFMKYIISKKIDRNFKAAVHLKVYSIVKQITRYGKVSQLVEHGHEHELELG